MGGAKARFPRTTYDVRAPTPIPGARFFALIWDCSTDSRVASDVRDQYQGLVSSGYTSILALRDVRPDFTLADIPNLKSGFARAVPVGPVTPRLVLAALEIEAWFVAEYSHFARIDRTLTPPYVNSQLGIDLIKDPVEHIQQPATLLNQIYGLAGAAYQKSRADVTKTVQALDLELLMSQLPTRAPNFAPLQAELVEFFTPSWRKLLRHYLPKIMSGYPNKPE
jgi:hypothetical protein